MNKRSRLHPTPQTSRVLMFNVISRACMHARTASDIYVEMCEEDKTEPGDEHRCGEVVKSMFVTRVAAHDWQSDVARTMKELGSLCRAERLRACSGIDIET